MYEYECHVTRIVDGDTLVVDVDLGFRCWLRGIHVRLSDVSAPEKNTPSGQDWIDWWHNALNQHGTKFLIRTEKDPKQTFSRWLGSIRLLNGTPVADLLDPRGERRHKHEG